MTQAWEAFVDFFETVLRTFADAFSFAGGHRWALAIVALTLATRTLVLPLAIKQIRSMRETQRLQPEMARLRQKFKSDRQRLMQEMQELYQREGVNPYASCLPMIAQAPVFMAIYFAIRGLKDVGAMSFLGLADLQQPASRTIGGWLLIALMTVAQLLSTRQLNPGQTDQQKRMQMLMPIVFVFLFMNFPVALVLYWTTSNLYQLVQQIIMTRDMRKPGAGWRGVLGLTPAEAPKKGGGKAKREEKPQVKKAAVAVAEPVAASGGPLADRNDPLANRRSLDEKRQRRRRKKKKRKR